MRILLESGVTAEGDKVHIGQMMNIELDFGEGRTCVPGRQGETAVVGSAKSVVAFGEMNRCQENFIIGLKDVAWWNMSVETDEQNNLWINLGEFGVWLPVLSDAPTAVARLTRVEQQYEFTQPGLHPVEITMGRQEYLNAVE